MFYTMEIDPIPHAHLPEHEAIPAQSNEQRARNIAQGLGSLTLQNLATSVLGFLFLAAMLRLLPRVQYGVYGAVNVSVSIGVTFAMLGLNQAMARYLAFLRERDEAQAWVAARRILNLALLFAVVVAGIYAAASPYLSTYFTKGQSWTGIFLLAGAYLFLGSLSGVCLGIVQGLKRYVSLAKMLFISKVVMVGFGIGLLFVYPNVAIPITAWIVYSATIIVWTLVLTGRKMVLAKGTFSYSEIFRYTYPLGIAAIVAAFATSMDVVVVGGYLNPASLAVYYAAVTISTILSAILVGPLTTAFLPEISSSSNDKEISNGLRLALRFAVLAVIPASLFVAAVPRQLISLFAGGNGYLAGAPILELIAVFYIFLAIEMIFVVLFQAGGKTIYVMVIGFATVASDIGVSVLLVPRLGLVGAATAKVSVGLVGALIGFYLARNYLKNIGGPYFYLKSLVSAVIPFLPTYALTYLFSDRTVMLLPYAIVYSIVFLACLKAFKLLSEEDKSFVSHILPKALHRFLRYF